ncbi:uncharacterized protein LOC127351221 [Dicentrarchus labrax]|uniref:uncharacterized protein LOC127351221 n=1 Tax=Dicentrarchus labrax TaxID=13489 RepID=UPI0021F5F185|nr:uncharacterized protein LOC127351221 [Dicentrarchus labrax]
MSKGGALSVREVLWKTLKYLGDEEFRTFKWFLQDSDILGDLGVIPRSELEKADRKDTVDKIIQKYNQQSVEVVKMILEKTDRADLVETLSSSFRTAAREEAPLRPPVVKATKDAQIINIPSIYKDIISNGVLIRPGPPFLFQLRPNKKKFGTWTGITVGEKDPAKTNRTILLVGETGTGKSTLVNALVNYTMGVKWEEDIWFQIVEEEKRSQSETSDVIIYEIFGFEDKTLPYSLTIIDTPGYGDTRGIEQDAIVSHRLLDWLRLEDGVQEINAVGLVLKATECRLSDPLSYIFDSVMSLFGKDMEKNIVALITHSDGLPPESFLQAVEKIKCAKDEENQPVHFMFNNCQSKQKTDRNSCALKSAWDLTIDGMSQFTHFLKETSPQKLKTTIEVLNSRIRLTACIQNLKERVELIELKQKEIQQTLKTQQDMKKYEKSKSDCEETTSLLENLEKQMEELQKEKDRWLEESFQQVVKLEQIALNTDSLSTLVHLDFLIEKMKEKGDTEKVQKLEEMKRRVDEDKGVQAALRYGSSRLTAGKGLMKNNKTSLTYEDFILKSNLIQSGSPAVYQLKPKKEKIGTIRRMTLGEKDLNKTNRTILLVGETGAGKSTLVNTLVNYTMGVKWEDNVWFQIVEDEKDEKDEKRSQLESQTSDVIIYEIFGFEDETLPYSLTIIDTPGYGDTRGIEHDEAVKHRLLDLFRSVDGVHEINAVGLVLKATEDQVSDRLRYIFDSVVSLFGKDMEKNIVALITHSDGLPPENVLQALEDANIKYAKDEDNEPVYFLFNNRQSTQKTKKNEFALKNAWSITADHICQFTDFLKETEPQKMMTTVQDKGVPAALRYRFSKLTAGKEVIQKNNTSLKYNDIISKSVLIQSGSPAVYQLKPKKEKIGTLTRMTLGEKDVNKTNRTILLVGETGAGKSTLVNTLVNYSMGVKWKDDVWFHIVEEEKRSQSESQTSDVIVYEIFGFEDETLPYSLTIINTPGYGDTRGIEQDEIISQRLSDLFRSEDGVHEINVVGLVLKATENRVSDRVRYIFDSVVSLFGKNIEKNIVPLITHSDGLTPENALKALEDANIKCAKDEDNEPVYFLFNNRQSTQKTKKTQFALKYVWSFTVNQICQFTDFLKETEPQKMITTVQDKGLLAALRYRLSKLTAAGKALMK